MKKKLKSISLKFNIIYCLRRCDSCPSNGYQAAGGYYTHGCMRHHWHQCNRRLPGCYHTQKECCKFGIIVSLPFPRFTGPHGKFFPITVTISSHSSCNRWGNVLQVKTQGHGFLQELGFLQVLDTSWSSWYPLSSRNLLLCAIMILSMVFFLHLLS